MDLGTLSMSKVQYHNHQPTVHELVVLGIKVRDFAYNNKLQSVQTVYQQPKQIQPIVPGFQQLSLQREKTQPDLFEASATQPQIQTMTVGSPITRQFGGFFG